MQVTKIVLGALALISMNMLFVGCDRREKKATDEKEVSSVTEASVILHPTKGNQASGKVTFTVVPTGVKVVADVSGLKPGIHGFHVHEFGDCSAPDGSSAGGHFNPTHAKHGGPNDLDRHSGDLGNIEADATGHAHYEKIDDRLKLEGPHTIVGRSVVIHADPDDFHSQPTGNSGGRVSCGVIKPGN
jgi:superoxide dismutase, Cu-Zn family